MSKSVQQKRKQKKYQSNHKGNTIHSSLAMRDMTLENMPHSRHARRISHIFTSQIMSYRETLQLLQCPCYVASIQAV